jgi:predicted nucleic acid-binding protein
LNWGEVFTPPGTSAGKSSRGKRCLTFHASPIELIPVDLSQALKAVEFMVVHRIPYVDCVAAALSERRQATLVTSDRDFAKLGRHFPILWIAHS